SVVVFGSGFSAADRLDGFTIKNGKGIVRTVETRISGGGIFSLSSPTISNNLITGNTLQGSQDYFNGGGIYLNAATSSAPVITRNTIDGNRAVPPSGTSSSYTYGLGGGIYAGFGSHPTISQNVISNNVAGDLNVAHSVGCGG